MSTLPREQALQVLTTALQNHKPHKPAWRAPLTEVFHGTHKTFRYILLTGILAKATQHSIHPRSLQKGWDHPRSYDARTLCHHVIVPNERTLLANRLGASNEPFLNKPARFPSVDMGNAVRRGRDRHLLKVTHDLLEQLDGFTRVQATQLLEEALDVILELESRIATTYTVESSELTSQAVSLLLQDLLTSSCEGETSALILGAILGTLHGHAHILVHPANQAGSSSNEVGDIDILASDSTRVVAVVEVKDKPFQLHDAWHACQKALENGCNELTFAMGPRGKLHADRTQLQRMGEDKGLDVKFIDLDAPMLDQLTSLLHYDRLRELLAALYRVAEQMRASETTRRHLDRTLQQHAIKVSS